MNWDRVEGQWKQMKGSVKSRWGKLTDDDLNVISGKKDQLVGRIQERYGIAKDEADKQVNEWNAALADDNARETRPLDRKAG
ncbi:MAG: CsbD family protein [Acidobacteriales bacterium]|nr:CsbD family protein [Terriglobales bacterium]